MKIIFATGNENKMREIREIYGDLDYEILSMKEAGIDSIEEIELKFRIREQDDYLNSVTTDAITFKVK